MTGRPKNFRRRAVVAELASLGCSQKRVAALLGVTSATASQLLKRMGLALPRERAVHDAALADGVPRANAMAALYRDGYTLERIGAQYKLTRERVRQIIGKYHRMNGDDGGIHVRSQRLRSRRASEREATYMAKYGCTFAQWRDMRDQGRALMAAGVSRCRTPIGAYHQQKSGAVNHRGIKFELTFWQWWAIWQASGHWDERGRGQGYVMCRKGDIGPYAVGNVYIDTAAHNSSEGQNAKKIDPSLPIGVSRTETGTFKAQRTINGASLRLGTFQSPELAHAAYLMAGTPGFKSVAGVRSGWASPGTRGYQTRGKRFYAYIYRGNKQVHLGSFATAEEARAAHLAAKERQAAA